MWGRFRVSAPPHDSPPFLGVSWDLTSQSQFSSHRPFSFPVSLDAEISSKISGSILAFDGFVVSQKKASLMQDVHDFFFLQSRQNRAHL